MNFEEVLPDTSRNTAEIVAQYILKNPEYFDQILKWSFSEKKIYGMRASRVVIICHEQQPDIVFPYLNDILEHLISTTNQSAIRNFMNLFISEFNSLNEVGLGKLIDFSFLTLESGFSEVAHKVYAMEILYQISNDLPEIKSELKTVIEHSLEEQSPAYQARSKKITNKLNIEIIDL